MYKQRRPDGVTENSSVSELQTLELIDKIEKHKDKYKRLKQLKTKNDNKLILAKKAVEDLKNKTGAELIEELGLISKSAPNKIDDILSKKRDQAMKGTFKMPKMKLMYNKTNKKGTENLIGTVHEIEEESIKSEDSNKSNPYLNKTEVTPEKKPTFQLTQDNLNKFSLKNERTKIQSSLVGGLLKSINPSNSTQSQINMRMPSSISCGKMFLMHDRLSYIGTQSMLGQPISTINSFISSTNDSQSQLFSEFSEQFSHNESRQSINPGEMSTTMDVSKLYKMSPGKEI